MISILFYALFLTFTLVYFVFFSIIFFLTVLFDRDRVVMHWLSRLWTKVYFGLIPTWTLQVDGLENIEKGKPYVVIVNHQSMLDIILMYVLPLNFKWVAKKEVYRWPIFGWVVRMHGDIGIERGSAGAIKKMIGEGGRWLSDGVSVIIFPEGSRSRTGEIGRFKEGAFVMAKAAGVAILPCVASGTGSAFKGWRINLKNIYRVRVLLTISAQEVQTADSHELAVKMQAKISQEYAKLVNGE